MSIEKRGASLGMNSLEKANQSKPLSTHQQNNFQASQNVIEDPRTIVLSIQDPNSNVPGVTGVLNIVKDVTWKKVYLDIRSCSTLVLGTIDGALPSGICLKAVELSGTKDLVDTATRTLAVCKPSAISGHVVAADISAYSALYEMKNVQCLWDITDVSALSFYITVAGSDTKVLPPYANDVVVELAILAVK